MILCINLTISLQKPDQPLFHGLWTNSLFHWVGFIPLNSLNNQGSFHCSVVAVTKHATSTFPVVQVEENIGLLHTNEKRKWHPIWKSWVWSSSHSEFWWGFIFLKCAMMTSACAELLGKNTLPWNAPFMHLFRKKTTNLLLAGTVKSHDPCNPPQPKLCGFSGLKTVDRWHRSPLINSFRWWANPLRDFWHGL